MKHEQDLALVQLALKADPLAFKSIVQLYESNVAAACIGLLGNCPEAQDVGQETFLRFYRNMHQYKGDAALKTYITRIAINLSLNQLKKRKRKFEIFKDQQSFEYNKERIPSVDFQERRDIKQVIHQGLELLDVRFRSVILLRMIHGYSTKETAELLEIPAGTVLSRLSTGQKKLKDIILNLER